MCSNLRGITELEFVIQCIPRISLTKGVPQSLGALSFVLLIEAFNSCNYLLVLSLLVRDDIHRHLADSKVNNLPVEVLNKETKQFEKRAQGSILVGDIVKVNEGDIFPADLLFLRSGDPKAPKSCWVNTKSLDGETDNKYRQALKVILRRRNDGQCTSEKDGIPINGTAEELSELQGIVNCELPNNMTNDFNGTVRVMH